MSPADRLASKKPKRKPRSDVPPVLACRVREWRKKKSLSLRDVCGKTGLTTATLWRIERGDVVSLPNARKLAAFFGATLDDLWPGRK